MGRTRWATIGLALVVAFLLGAGLVAVVTRSSDATDATEAGTSAAGDPGGTPSPTGPRLDPVAEVPVPGGTSRLPGRRSASRAEVERRPWPARVAATGPWTSTLAGLGDRIQSTAPGTILGGIASASATFDTADPREQPRTRNQLLLLPDGTRWYPLAVRSA